MQEKKKPTQKEYRGTSQQYESSSWESARQAKKLALLKQKQKHYLK